MKMVVPPADVVLDFATLRAANLHRLPLFKNSKGRPAHSKPDGSDWSRPEWCNAVLGELGELANLLKKVQRGDMTMDEARPAIGKELADVQTYLDILAYQCQVNLGAATVAKFNEVSDRVGCGVKITGTYTLEVPMPRPPSCPNCNGRGWFSVDMEGSAFTACPVCGTHEIRIGLPCRK